MREPTDHRDYHTPTKYYDNYYSSSKGNHRCGDWICVNCNNLNYSFRKKCNRCKTISRDRNFMTPVYSYYYYTNNMQDDSKETKQMPIQTKNLYIGQKDTLKHLEVPEKQNKFKSSRTRQKENVNNSKSNQEKKSQGLSGQNVVSQFESNQENSSVKTSSKEFRTPLKNKDLNKNQDKKIEGFGTPQLPSVSPLLKKYKQSKNRKQKQSYNTKYLSNKQKYERDQALFSAGNHKYLNSNFTSLNGELFDSQRQLQWANLIVRDFNEIMEEKPRIDEPQLMVTDEMERLISNILLSNQ